MRRTLWFFALGLMLVAALTACSGTQEATPASSQATEAASEAPVTIEVYYPVAVDAPISNILKGYIADFEKEHPNIKVKPVFAGGYGDVKTT
ncbi:MAG: ABC transporter substrate-binding protein, partial [Chloroflexi bacterium]|nr:ABC transporter substrate-binding protein [Chloroflexota bacterium]